MKKLVVFVVRSIVWILYRVRFNWKYIIMIEDSLGNIINEKWC